MHSVVDMLRSLLPRNFVHFPECTGEQMQRWWINRNFAGITPVNLMLRRDWEAASWCWGMMLSFRGFQIIYNVVMPQNLTPWNSLAEEVWLMEHGNDKGEEKCQELQISDDLIWKSETSDHWEQICQDEMWANSDLTVVRIAWQPEPPSSQNCVVKILNICG